MNPEKIGKLIEKKRHEKKLTQEELASVLYVSNKTISKWERGKGIPSVDLLLPLSETLDIDIKEILGGKETTLSKALLEERKSKKRKQVINLIIGIILCLFLCFLEVILYISNVSSKNATIIFVSFIIIIIIIDIGNYFLNKK